MSDLYLKSLGEQETTRIAANREGAHRRMRANDKFRAGRHRAPEPKPEPAPVAVVSAPVPVTAEQTRVISAEEQVELLARARQGVHVPGEHLTEISFDEDGQVSIERLVTRARGAAMAADHEIGTAHARRSIAQLWQETLAVCLKALPGRGLW